jgi:outer membrane protein OmpA-like peptidoglycan-associated protein
MIRFNSLLAGILSLALLVSSCGPLNKTKKGALIGTLGGAVLGTVIGKAAGNPAMGAIVGATVGGVTGTVIGRKMDKQAEEIKKQVPGVKVERVGEGINVEFTEKILFDFSKAELGTTSKSSLDKLIVILTKYPDTNIEIQGHTDARGADEYNMALSERRATAVVNYLKQQGVVSTRITPKPFGESAPIATNDTEEGRAQNRRVNFIITANEKMKAEASKENTDK